MAYIHGVGVEAFRYSLEDFREHGALAWALGDEAVAGMGSVVIAPGSLPVDVARDFRWGKPQFIDPFDGYFEPMSSFLVDRFPEGRLFLELPLPEEVFTPKYSMKIIKCGEAIFASCEIAAGYVDVERTLRAHDPTFLYYAVVLGWSGSGPAPECPEEWLRSDDGELLAILTGIYDGEGFIVTTAPDLLPKEDTS